MTLTKHVIRDITGSKVLVSGMVCQPKGLIEIARSRGVSLVGADMAGMNLKDADFTGLDLRYARLTGANLYTAIFDHAKVYGVEWPSPPMVLLADWDGEPKDLVRDLMRYDAANHPNPQRFLEWARGGSCPYTNVKFERSANFSENRELIKRGFLKIKPKSAYELAMRLIKENCNLNPQGE